MEYTQSFSHVKPTHDSFRCQILMETELQKDKGYGLLSQPKNEMLQQLDIMFRETWLCTQRHLIRVNILSQQPMQCYPKGINSKYCAQKLPTVLRILA